MVAKDDCTQHTALPPKIPCRALTHYSTPQPYFFLKPLNPAPSSNTLQRLTHIHTPQQHPHKHTIAPLHTLKLCCCSTGQYSPSIYGNVIYLKPKVKKINSIKPSVKKPYPLLVVLSFYVHPCLSSEIICKVCVCLCVHTGKSESAHSI